MSYLPTMTGNNAYYAPGGGPYNEGTSIVSVDPGNQIRTRSTILTDESGYRINFSGNSVARSIGFANWTSGSDKVVAAGTTDFSLYDLHMGDYVFPDTATISAAKTVYHFSSTEICLNDAWTGASVTSAASSRQIMKTKTGTGQSVQVVNGQAVFVLGSTNNQTVELERDVDYLPLSKQTGFALSQRIANQTSQLGFYDENEDGDGSPRWFAYFEFTGTDNTQVLCKTAKSTIAAPTASETEITTATLPSGQTTNLSNRYKIEVAVDKVTFYINGQLVAQHYKSIPGPYDLLVSTTRVINETGASTGTSAFVDYDICRNFDRIDIGPANESETFTMANMPNVVTSGVLLTATAPQVVVDCNQYKELFITLANPANAVATPEWSNVSTFVTSAAAVIYPVGGGAGVTTQAASTTGLYAVPVKARYFRIRNSGTSGALTYIIWGNHQPSSTPVQTTQPISGSVTATVTSTRITPNAADGHSTLYTYISSAGDNAIVIGGAATVVGSLVASNSATSPAFLKLYNVTSVPTTATATSQNIMIPANTTLQLFHAGAPVRFSTGLAMRITKSPVTGATDTTYPAAGDVIVNIART